MKFKNRIYRFIILRFLSLIKIHSFRSGVFGCRYTPHTLSCIPRHPFPDPIRCKSLDCRTQLMQRKVLPTDFARRSCNVYVRKSVANSDSAIIFEGDFLFVLICTIYHIWSINGDDVHVAL